MNKLIIVGNGFDLDNGIRSSYNDFVKWQIGKLIKTQFRGESIDCKLMSVSITPKLSTSSHRHCDSIENIVDEIFRPELFRDSGEYPKTIVYKQRQDDI